MDQFSSFAKKIGVSFKDPTMLRQAFTHRSYINENKHERLEHNERLEFLGDAVLELAVTEFLYRAYPEKPEGELTAIRAALVNTTSLSATAMELGMSDLLFLSRGEAKDTGRARQYILANTFEALIGAMYLDQGFEATSSFIRRFLTVKTEDIVSQKLWQDAKSRFQELAQERVAVTPSYQTLRAAGPDHDRHFTVGIYIDEEKIAEGEGKSKQEAEQDAAQNALDAKGWS